MFIERQGHRYRDGDAGQTIDVWFPESEGEPIRRGFAADLAALFEYLGQGGRLNVPPRKALTSAANHK